MQSLDLVTRVGPMTSRPAPGPTTNIPFRTSGSELITHPRCANAERTQPLFGEARFSVKPYIRGRADREGVSGPAPRRGICMPGPTAALTVR